MFLNELLEHLGSYCEDLKFNMEEVLSEDGAPGLSKAEIYGIALASSYATGNETLSEFMFLLSQDFLTTNEAFAAKSAASLMAMNNVYYRFCYNMENDHYRKKHSNLRMDVFFNHKINKLDFELYCLAVSAINGCFMSMRAHEKKVLKNGATEDSIHSCIRIAAVINGVARALTIG